MTLWAANAHPSSIYLSASVVELDGIGILLCGPSGAGKSTMAIELISLGARLVCDDGIFVELVDGTIRLRRPPTATGLIEARGIGLLNAGGGPASTTLGLVVDLGRNEPHRLPPARFASFGSVSIPLLLGAGVPNLAACVRLLLRHGRAEPEFEVSIEGDEPCE